MYKEKIEKLYGEVQRFLERSKTDTSLDFALEVVDFYENVIEPRSLAFSYYKKNLEDFIELVDNCYEKIEREMPDEVGVEDLGNLEDLEELEDIEDLEELEELGDIEDLDIGEEERSS